MRADASQTISIFFVLVCTRLFKTCFTVRKMTAVLEEPFFKILDFLYQHPKFPVLGSVFDFLQQARDWKTSYEANRDWKTGIMFSLVTFQSLFCFIRAKQGMENWNGKLDQKTGMENWIGKLEFCFFSDFPIPVLLHKRFSRLPI